MNPHPDEQAREWLYKELGTFVQEPHISSLAALLAKARLAEAEWWQLKAVDVMDAALENIPAEYSIPWKKCQERIASLRQAAGEGKS